MPEGDLTSRPKILKNKLRVSLKKDKICEGQPELGGTTESRTSFVC